MPSSHFLTGVFVFCGCWVWYIFIHFFSGWFQISQHCDLKICMAWSRSFCSCWRLFCDPYLIYSRECSTCTWGECVFCCFRIKCSEYICWIHLFQCLIQSLCFLVDFLLRWFVHCCKRSSKGPCNDSIINKFAYVCDLLIYIFRFSKLGA